MKLLKISIFRGLPSLLIRSAFGGLQLACLLSGMVICNLCYSQPVIQEWVCRYPDTNIFNAGANALVLDDSGNVYVTGFAFGNPGPYRYCTLKYSASGKLQWVNQYYGDSTGGRFAFDIALDNSSNVYVTGYSSDLGTGFDYCTIKYNSMGVQQWVRYYDSPLHGEDEAEKIAVDNAGNIYVSGYSTVSSGANFGYATVKYSPEGSIIWVRTFGGGVTTHVKGLLVDDSCYVYITGQNMQRAVTIKYDSSGTELWSRIYYGVGPPSTGANSIALDANKNVCITGFSKGIITNSDFFTIKYSYSGVQQWVRRFNTDSTSIYSFYLANSIAVDDIGNVYATGYFTPDYNLIPAKFCSIKYSNFGDLLWVQKDSVGVTNGGPYMVIDNFSNIYVTGTTTNFPSNPSITTIKYDSSGSQRWSQNYFVTGNSYPRCLKVDDNYNVFLTGVSNTYMCTIKYSQLVAINTNKEVVRNYRLNQNYPNPFNSFTVINYQLPIANNVRLILYDVLGREVKTLVNENQHGGNYNVILYGSNYPSGIYFYKIIINEFSEAKKMTLLK